MLDGLYMSNYISTTWRTQGYMIKVLKKHTSYYMFNAQTETVNTTMLSVTAPQGRLSKQCTWFTDLNLV
jgi:hypothetical protein